MEIPETDRQVLNLNFGLEKVASSNRAFTLMNTMATLKHLVGKSIHPLPDKNFA